MAPYGAIVASTLTRILIHIVFSTKNRGSMISQEIEPELYAYVGGICRRLGSPLLDMGGTADHVHLLVSLAKTISVSDLLLNVKRDSSKWVKEQQNSALRFGWQDGYFAFSIGESGVDPLRKYIAKQKEHHALMDFKEEMRLFLRKYGVDWDERYAWD